MDQFVYGLRGEIRVHTQKYACNGLEELVQQAVQIEHENKEPEPLDPPDESPLPKNPTEMEAPSEEAQQHSKDITMSHEQVLRTKLFQEGGYDAGIKSNAHKDPSSFKTSLHSGKSLHVNEAYGRFKILRVIQRASKYKGDKTYHIWTQMNLDDINTMVRFTQLTSSKIRPSLKPPYQLLKTRIKVIKGVVNTFHNKLISFP